MTLLPLPHSSTKVLYYLPADAVSAQCVYKKQHSVCVKLSSYMGPPTCRQDHLPDGLLRQLQGL